MADAVHETLIQTHPQAVRERLEAIQAEVERRVPDAARCIAYKMPAFRIDRVFFYFEGFKKHIGVYPPVNAPADLVERTGPYRGPKGNLSFPHDQPLPLDLIGEVAETLARNYGRKG